MSDLSAWQGVFRWRDCPGCGSSFRGREGSSCRRCLGAVVSRKQVKKLSEKRRRARMEIRPEERNPKLEALLGRFAWP